MAGKDRYDEAHLVVAAIRVLEHQNDAPPLIEKVCEMLAFSLEHGNIIFNYLIELGVIDVVTGAFGNRVTIKDHLKIEEIPRDKKESTLEEDVKRFQNERKDINKELASFQARQAEKKKKLFAEIESGLKNR